MDTTAPVLELPRLQTSQMQLVNVFIVQNPLSWRCLDQVCLPAVPWPAEHRPVTSQFCSAPGGVRRYPLPSGPALQPTDNPRHRGWILACSFMSLSKAIPKHRPKSVYHEFSVTETERMKWGPVCCPRFSSGTSHHASCICPALCCLDYFRVNDFSDNDIDFLCLRHFHMYF